MSSCMWGVDWVKMEDGKYLEAGAVECEHYDMNLWGPLFENTQTG